MAVDGEEVEEVVDCAAEEDGAGGEECPSADDPGSPGRRSGGHDLSHSRWQLDAVHGSKKVLLRTLRVLASLVARR